MASEVSTKLTVGGVVTQTEAAVRTKVLTAGLVLTLSKPSELKTSMLTIGVVMQAHLQRETQQHGSLTVVIQNDVGATDFDLYFSGVEYKGTNLSVHVSNGTLYLGNVTLNPGTWQYGELLFWDRVVFFRHGGGYAAALVEGLTYSNSGLSVSATNGVTVALMDAGDGYGGTYIETGNTIAASLSTVMTSIPIGLDGGYYYIASRHDAQTISLSDSEIISRGARAVLPRRVVAVGQDIVPVAVSYGERIFGSAVMNIPANGMDGVYALWAMRLHRRAIRVSAPVTTRPGDVVSLSATSQVDGQQQTASIEVQRVLIRVTDTTFTCEAEGVER